MGASVDRTAYANYLRSLQLPSGLGSDFEDQAFPILFGLTRLRQVPLAARKAWQQALVQANNTTPNWAKALPDGEYRFRFFSTKPHGCGTPHTASISTTSH